MPSREQVTAWMKAYRKAWESNESADIGRLFSEQASYYTEPYTAPWRGREAIVENWIARKDEPGAAEFSWQPLAIDDEVAVVQGQTIYHDPPQTYSNMWVIRLDSRGECTEFTEWWMLHDQKSD
jgi:hypothetical protein